MNKVMLTGRMTADPELKYTQSNIPVTQFNLAVERIKGNEKGVDYVPIVAWRKYAETICKYLRKGSKILVVGNLIQEVYERQDNSTVSAIKVLLETVEFLDNRSQNNKQDDEEDVYEETTDDKPF